MAGDQGTEAPLQQALLAGTDLRDLPWRRTRDPWAVLVAETMLQQTQVARVVPRYEAFLGRFPRPADCAAAPAGDVLGLWAGLGYNRRAMDLRASAQVMCAEHGGSVPDDLAALLALPGVGPYTARAVLAFAFERDVAVVDTNIARVLARLHRRRLSRREVQELAESLVPPGAGWRWNQALMEHGALVCTARAPACTGCPLHPWCGWGGRGEDPAAGSAGVSARQSRFAGSDRQGRGRLVAALCAGAVPEADLATVMGWPEDPERARRVADGVVHDGLARRRRGAYVLP